jgi:hypothetical protein
MVTRTSQRLRIMGCYAACFVIGTITFASCGSSVAGSSRADQGPIDDGAKAAGDPTGAGRGDRVASRGAAAPSAITDLLQVIERLGAVYLVDQGRCEEWQASIGGDRISLVRITYIPGGYEKDLKERRLWQRRAIAIRQDGLALSGESEWRREEVDQEGPGIVRGGVGSDLCEATAPGLRSIKRHLHYIIGGADLFLTRRACEEAAARASDGNPLALSSCRGP